MPKIISVTKAALREAEEELGIPLDPHRLKQISNYNEMQHSKKIKGEGKNNEYITVFVYDATKDEISAIEKKYNKAEILQLFWMEPDVLRALITDAPNRLARSTRRLFTKSKYQKIAQKLFIGENAGTKKSTASTLVLTTLPFFLGAVGGSAWWLLPYYFILSAVWVSLYIRNQNKAVPIAVRTAPQSERTVTKNSVAATVNENLGSPQSLGMDQLLPGPALELAAAKMGVQAVKIDSVNDDRNIDSRIALAAGPAPEEKAWVSNLLTKYPKARIRLSVNPETAKNGVYNDLRKKFGGERLEIVSVQGLMSLRDGKEVLHANKFVDDITNTKERMIVYVRTDADTRIDNPDSLKGLQGLRLVLFNLIKNEVLTIPTNVTINNLIETAQEVATNA